VLDRNRFHRNRLYFSASTHGVQVVGGSNPLAPTKFPFHISSLRDAATSARHAHGENSRVLGEFAFTPVLASEIVRGKCCRQS